ncbi:hypothetical protein CJ030_MR3G017066 [Morella rubra]|uniref:Coenzyme Q-binding protein COQ10 START domain-containing protein n=1 Tax=Morella rubra TaxID=262757 RepID=A0A6A1W4U2_9ROSI|nr:hypothetical protein CJ030_MR3G017066 [Morella rubra]
MPPFMSTSKAVGTFISRKDGIRHLLKSVKSSRQLQKFDHIRCSNSIVGTRTRSVLNSVSGLNDLKCLSRRAFDNGHTVQTRLFIGCGDGEEGGVLSKVHEERRVMGYSPEQLFDVVAAVDLYHGFVPWCQRSDIRTTAKDTALFDHLINIWEFNPGPVPGTCNLYFLVDFKFESPLYRQDRASWVRKAMGWVW